MKNKPLQSPEKTGNIIAMNKGDRSEDGLEELEQGIKQEQQNDTRK